jgi:hypothetical protein
MVFVIQMIVVATLGAITGEAIKWFALKRLSDIRTRARHEERFVSLAHQLLRDDRLPETHRRRIVGYAKSIRTRQMETVVSSSISLSSLDPNPKQDRNPNRALPADLSQQWQQMFLSFLLAVTYRSFFKGRVTRSSLYSLFDPQNLNSAEKIVDERGLKDYAFAV